MVRDAARGAAPHHEGVELALEPHPEGELVLEPHPRVSAIALIAGGAAIGSVSKDESPERPAEPAFSRSLF